MIDKSLNFSTERLSIILFTCNMLLVLASVTGGLRRTRSASHVCREGSENYKCDGKGQFIFSPPSRVSRLARSPQTGRSEGCL